MSDWNQELIAEFRANDGEVGGHFENQTLLLLHTTGAKTGKARITPLIYIDWGGNYVVAASKAGAHTHPDWYHNLVANPDVTIEVGSAMLPATARVLEGPARTAAWDSMKSAFRGYASYEERTDRVIPVVLLEPKPA